jgi:hypothetical protein
MQESKFETLFRQLVATTRRRWGHLLKVRAVATAIVRARA